MWVWLCGYDIGRGWGWCTPPQACDLAWARLRKHEGAWEGYLRERGRCKGVFECNVLIRTLAAYVERPGVRNISCAYVSVPGGNKLRACVRWPNSPPCAASVVVSKSNGVIGI